MKSLEITTDVELSNRMKEVFRTLRTNLEFSGVENRAIAVTSCTPNDGKSTVSYNLAMMLAERGKNTLYVDADLRKSVLVQRLGIKGNPEGLSHYLSGQTSLQDVIYTTQKQGLYILPAGVFPSNPTELLANGKFSVLLESAKKVFDYIIVDTPPLASVIDAAVIAKECDASMLVLASGIASRNMARSVISQLKLSNPNFLGVVLNKVEIKQGAYYSGKGYGGYYGSYYGYYGSYYGAEETSSKKVSDDIEL